MARILTIRLSAQKSFVLNVIKWATKQMNVNRRILICVISVVWLATLRQDVSKFGMLKQKAVDSKVGTQVNSSFLCGVCNVESRVISNAHHLRSLLALKLISRIGIISRVFSRETTKTQAMCSTLRKVQLQSNQQMTLQMKEMTCKKHLK